MFAGGGVTEGTVLVVEAPMYSEVIYAQSEDEDFVVDDRECDEKIS